MSMGMGFAGRGE
ncbi:hypothetical protein Zm00014a_034889 [Zea mays]|uniref:Uncharacterized protein n=1 Tax=Zea mays TaxID=4577 RepID=A0A3L6DI19_MAIZE|nr:hypothetical protein Zm00014a_034889 [Zea mays]